MTQGNGSSGGSSSSSSKVAVRFSDGSSAEYDLVIGADGQNSRTRRLMLQGETDDSALFNTLGVYYAYFQMPKIAGDAENRACECYHIPGSKVAIARHGHPDFTQVIFAIRGDTKELEETVSLPVEQQKALFTRLFKGTGWKIDHLLDGMESSDDFYMHVAAQANLETWSKGRIVLVGDAGYCASPLSGLGTTVSLVGAYVLAGELARHGDDVSAALASYEKVLRPFIKTAYVLPPGVPGLAFWVTIWGIKFFHFVMWLIAFLRIDKIVTAIEPAEKAGWKLPEYPELDLEE
ncbi:hypothetical protein BX600DRAFT_464880 [Xylariales sp. PMI_506]|nr:hypothetical protein BX600DRAFT_464880 [Xylariales sp. PMI_506]